ncbi:MAG: PT domain-containing protein [Lachnospiraceae bacterium]|nr:PT domain-containing protein [Lachnospiraceae bacterium]
MKKESHFLSVNRLLVIVLILALALITAGCSKKSNSVEPTQEPAGEATATPTGETTPTAGPTADPTAAPTEIPSPTATPTPVVTTAYGDLSQYIGMSAGELIEKIDKPYVVPDMVFYTYEGGFGHGMITFDKTVFFALSSKADEVTADKAPEGYVIAVQIAEPWKAGSLSLGNGFTTSMKYSELQAASGDALLFARESYPGGDAPVEYIAPVFKNLCKYTFTWRSEDPDKEDVIPEVILIEGRAFRQLNNNAELYKLALEHNTQYLADLRSSYKDVTVRKGGYLGSFKTDKGTVEVYDSAVYGRPAEVDSNPDSATGFTGKADTALECYDYSLFFRTMSNSKCIDSTYSSFPAAIGSNPSKTAIEITNRLFWYDGGEGYSELLKNSRITLKKTDDYYAMAGISRMDSMDYRDAVTTSYYSGKDNSLLLTYSHIDVHSNNGYSVDVAYYGPDGKQAHFGAWEDTSLELLKKLDSGEYLTNDDYHGLTSAGWIKYQLSKNLLILDFVSFGTSDIDAAYLVTDNFLIPLYEHCEPGGGIESIIRQALTQKNTDISDEALKKRYEQYLAELRTEYKDVPVHKSGLLATATVTGDTTVEVYESAVYGRPIKGNPKNDAAKGYTYTGVDETVECYNYTVTARVLKNGRYTVDYSSSCVLYNDGFVTGNTDDTEITIANELIWSYKEDRTSAVTCSDFPFTDSLPWTENEVIDGSQPYIAVAGITRRFSDQTEGYSMHAYYYYYNTAYYLGSDTKPILGRCYAQEIFSYYSLGERITDSEGRVLYTESGTNVTGNRRIQSSGDGFGTTGKTMISMKKTDANITETWEKQPLNSKVNLITMTLTNSALEKTYVYSYLSCGESNLVAFDLNSPE